MYSFGKRSNARRLKWPWNKATNSPYDERGNPLPAYVDLQRDVSVCYDLVAIIGEMLGKPLKLILGGPRSSPPIVQAYTTGNKVYIPKMHPQLRIAVKHELGHHAYESDVDLRRLFVENLVESLQQRGAVLDSAEKTQLIEDLCFLDNIFDDIRVNSLWGLLMPGDGADMRSWYYGNVGPDMKRKAEKEVGTDVSHLFTYCMLLCLCQEVESSRWGRFKEEIKQAASDVHFVDYEGSLLILKRLFLKIAEELIKEEKEKDKCPSTAPAGAEGDAGDEEKDSPEALSRAISKMLGGLLPSNKFCDHNAGFDWKKEVSANYRSAQNVDKCSKLHKVDVLDDDTFSQALSQRGDAALGKVAQLSKALSASSGNQMQEGDFLSRGVMADVNIIKVQKRDVVPALLSREDLQAAEKWKRLFQRIMGTTSTRLEEFGREIDPDMYIQNRLSSAPIPYYIRDVAGRGFRLTLLVDMSYSMHSDFKNVEKLFCVLQRALQFPFVHLQVMGFNSTKAGEVNIYKYPTGVDGLISPTSSVGGITPLSHAIQVAGRSMLAHRDENHLFVLSDGFPVYYLKGSKRINTASLVTWTSDAVRELRKRRVNTWCFMAGEYTPGSEAMDKMFGPKRWKKIRSDQIYADSLHFLTQRFMNYLRTR